MYIVEIFSKKERITVKTEQEAIKCCHALTAAGEKCGIHRDIASKIERMAYNRITRIKWGRK